MLLAYNRKSRLLLFARCHNQKGRKMLKWWWLNQPAWTITHFEYELQKENYTQYASQMKPVTTTPNRCASAMERRQRYFQLRDYLTMYSKSCVCLFIFFGFVLSACLLALTSDCCEPYAKKFMAAHYTISCCLAGAGDDCIILISTEQNQFFFLSFLDATVFGRLRPGSRARTNAQQYFALQLVIFVFNNEARFCLRSPFRRTNISSLCSNQSNRWEVSIPVYSNGPFENGLYSQLSSMV